MNQGVAGAFALGRHLTFPSPKSKALATAGNRR